MRTCILILSSLALMVSTSVLGTTGPAFAQTLQVQKNNTPRIYLSQLSEADKCQMACARRNAQCIRERDTCDKKTGACRDVGNCGDINAECQAKCQK